jgi:hypothetical protein
MRGNPVNEVTLARIRKAAREGRFEHAGQDRIGCHRQQVDRILREIGFAEALVTDESSFSDFQLDEAVYGRMTRKFGFKVLKTDCIASIAERLAK